jgi:hypothetical protein
MIKEYGESKDVSVGDMVKIVVPIPHRTTESVFESGGHWVCLCCQFLEVSDDCEPVEYHSGWLTTK